MTPMPLPHGWDQPVPQLSLAPRQLLSRQSQTAPANSTISQRLAAQTSRTVTCRTATQSKRRQASGSAAARLLQPTLAAPAASNIHRTRTRLVGKQERRARVQPNSACCLAELLATCARQPRRTTQRAKKSMASRHQPTHRRCTLTQHLEWSLSGETGS
ncbi:hypothetical protein DL89DRAFT_139815 [Linderina pennispora]|uniref:Uncharacterized protein n=1 Tax=Linderina pennispora TaxID=61395 RepID=A0A1Y1WBR4_9FUNG|nr:uncharacterized protein DL89DRAFT_139815 [Linderina pennispora]ORX70758.1 hypothetical protein DL89DRAFT_139815 [Linderina pennispora]